jgi:proteic killer suppression protein
MYRSAFTLTPGVNAYGLDITFRTKKLRKQCTDAKQMATAFGSVQASRLRQRLDDLRAAENLEVMRTLPGRCHELKAARAGQLSVDLDHPYRLIFEPANNPVPQHDDGGLDWSAVTAVRILEIADTHG